MTGGWWRRWRSGIGYTALYVFAVAVAVPALVLAAMWVGRHAP